jgi:replicative DNA helicase
MDTALERFEAALRAAGCHQSRAGGDWTCPAHDDSTPSLSVAFAEGKVLLCCHAGCSTNAILERLGLTWRDLHDEDPSPTRERSRIVETYPYEAADGTVRYRVVRTDPKGFYQQRPDGRGGWTNGLGDVERVLFHLTDVLEAVAVGGEVWVVEGEKDVEAIRRTGAVATCNPGGVGMGWREDYTQSLLGAGLVRVVADNDDKGLDHGRKVVASLTAAGIPVEMLRAANEFKDAAEHLGAGLTLDDLVPLEVVQVEPPADDPPHRIRIRGGDTFVLDDPADLEPIWGTGEEIAWPSGESLEIVAPTGVGKTTLQNLLIAGRLGIRAEVLGWPIQPATRPILLMAMDRPNQIRRALRRVFGEQHREVLRDGLIIWQGPPPADLGRHPEVLAELVNQVGAGEVFIDSLKDAAVHLTDDEVGGNLNRAMQTLIADGIQVVANHHQRKSQNGAKPRTLEDVYGSTWITAGAGSVLLLWGSAGDAIVELNHLKAPATEIGPFRVDIDHATGAMTVYRGFDALQFVLYHPGCTAKDAAVAMFEKPDPDDNQRRRAQRKLDALVRADPPLARRDEPVRGGAGGAVAARYYVLEHLLP